MKADATFLAELAEKFERETQVYLGYVNVERAEQLRDIAARLAALTAENEILRRALIAHRVDLHNGSSRPCSTCYQSAHALGIADRVPNRCALADADAAALPSSRETTDERA